VNSNLIRVIIGLSAASVALMGCTIGGVKSDDTGTTPDTTPRDSGNSGPGGNPGGNPGSIDSGDTSGGPGGPGGGDVDCDATESAPEGPSCVSSTISCGDTIEGNTQGGTNVLDEEFYQSATCFVPYHDLDNSERVYELIINGEGDPMTVDITLTATCGDLGMAAFYWSGDECPEGAFHNINNCDGKDISNNAAVQLYSTGEDEERYLISVDGDETAAFKLQVVCNQ